MFSSESLQGKQPFQNMMNGGLASLASQSQSKTSYGAESDLN